jgi:hypothetical protein
MAPYLMNHYLRKYLIKIWCVLFYRRHHTFDVKTCFQQNRHVFDVIVTLWALFFFVFRGILPAIFRRFLKKLSTSASCTRNIFYQIIKINKTQILLKYFFGARGVKFLEKWRENVQILKDEVLLTVSCSIFPSILIAKNLLTGSLKIRSIDNLETQK